MAASHTAKIALIKSRAAAASASARRSASAAIADMRGRNAARIKQERSLRLVSTGGNFVGAAASGQVARVDPGAKPKENKKGYGRMINYGSGALGLVMMFRARSTMAVAVAAVPIGMAMGQLAIDSFQRDWWPFKETK